MPVSMSTSMSSSDCNSFSFQFKKGFHFHVLMFFVFIHFSTSVVLCCVVSFMFYSECLDHKMNCNNEPFLDARWFHYNQHNNCTEFYVKHANIKTRFNGKYLHLYVCDTQIQAGQKEEDTNAAIRHKWP